MAAMMAAMMAAPQQQTCATREFNYCAGVNARFSCRYNLANSNEDGPGLHHFLDKIELLSASDFVWWWMLLQRGGINTCFQLLVQACLAGSRQECNLSGQNRGKGQRPRQHRADPRKATAKTTQGHLSGANKTPGASAHHYHQLTSSLLGAGSGGSQRLRWMRCQPNVDPKASSKSSTNGQHPAGLSDQNNHTKTL
ncbi:uncharacterized protein LOC121895364 isoform X4 [Thunnus maccoyii]|uniref:uncharacterized protein LOC121895364 isoform X4 n=1 Tax=Thunnus maccoyii TaxID=8240 RepID=UPI001C4B645B|nr:uncharacterized protein LOC121895364 isoform X4 [Thunnus maccoyii]